MQNAHKSIKEEKNTNNKTNIKNANLKKPKKENMNLTHAEEAIPGALGEEDERLLICVRHPFSSHLLKYDIIQQSHRQSKQFVSEISRHWIFVNKLKMTPIECTQDSFNSSLLHSLETGASI